MDVGASRIGPEQALEIAKEIQKGERKEIPKWLNRTEKETVEASLDFLLATDKALKTWWVKSNYLEKRKKATLRRRGLQASQQRFAEVSADLLNVSLFSRAMGSELKAFNDELDRLLTDYAERAFKAEKMAGKAKLRRWFRESPYSRFVQSTFNAQFWYSMKDVLPPDLKREFIKMKEPEETPGFAESWARDHRKTAARIVSQLSETGRALSNEFHEKYRGLLQKYPSAQTPEASMVFAYLASPDDPPWGRALHRLQDVRSHFEKVTAKAEAEEAKWKTQCKFAGTFYIIAAMGEFMEDLARSIG